MRKCSLHFRNNPTELHKWNKQREAFIEKKRINPNFRIRSADQLGPCQELATQEEAKETLTAPLRFFVEVATYTQMMSHPPEDSNLVYKKFQGATLCGAVCIGRVWKMAWEDGMRGIYKLEGESSVGVKRTATLLSTEDSMLSEGVLDEAEKKATSLLLGQSNSNSVVNEPSMDKACAYLGMSGLSKELDDLLGDDFGKPSSSMPSAAVCPSSMRSLPPVPTNEGACKSEDAGYDDAPMSAFDAMRMRALPVGVASSEGKAKAKPKAKQNKNSKSAKEEPEEGGGTRKRRKTNVENLDPNSDNAKATGGRGSNQDTSGMIANDTAWYNEANDSLKKLLEFNPPEGDAEFRTAVSDLTKELGEIQKKITTRKRTLRRRSEDNKQVALDQANEIQATLDEYTDVIKTFGKNGTMPVDECLGKIKKLQEAHSECSFGPEAMKRLACMLWQDDMKFQRWENMMKETLAYAKGIPESNKFSLNAFVMQQMTLILQKLLKTIPADQVTIASPAPDCMEPFQKFIAVMIQSYPAEAERVKFGWLQAISACTEHTPGEVDDALANVKKDTTPVAASFKAIAQGKRFMLLSEQHSQGKAHLLKASTELSEICQRCEAHTLALPSIKPEDAFQKFASEISSLKAVVPKVPSDDSACQKALANAKQAVQEFANSVVEHHCMQEAIPWIQTQNKTLESSKIVSRPPGFAVSGVNPLAEKILGCPVTKVLDLNGFYKSMEGIAESTDKLLRVPGDDLDQLRSVALSFCQAFAEWNTSVEKLRCSFPELFETTEEMRHLLNKLVGEVCHKVWKDTVKHPVEVATRIVKRAEFEIEFLKGSSERMSDASLLLTGLTDSESKDQMKFASVFLSSLITFAEAELLSSETPKSAGCILKMFQDLDFQGKDAGLECSMTFPEEKVKLSSQMLWQTLWETAGSEEAAISAVDLEGCFDRLWRNMINVFKTSVAVLTESVSKNIAMVKALEPLPVFQEGVAGSDKAFLEAMMSGKRHTTISDAVDALTNLFQKAEEECREFKVPITAVLKDIDVHKKELESFTKVSCLSTCLRILLSKAASNCSHALEGAIEKTLAFASEKSVELPDSVKNDMNALLKKIKAAAAAAKRERSRSRKANP